MAKRRICLGVLALCAGLLYFFENSGVTLALFAGTVLLPILSVILCRIASKGIACTINAPGTGKKGEGLEAEITVSGGAVSSFRCSVNVRNTLTGEVGTYGFDAAGRTERLQLVPSHCGTLSITVSVSATDAFGIYESGGKAYAEAFTVIEPKLFEVTAALSEELSVSAEGDTYSADKAGFDPSETFGIREYVPGDPVKQIHWKLSQKSDKLMLRELGLPVSANTLVVFESGYSDVNEEKCSDTLDAMAEVFLSLSHSLLSMGVPHTVMWKSAKLRQMEVKTDEDYSEMNSCFLSDETPFSKSPIIYENAESLMFSHFVIISARAAASVEALTQKGRVTLITPDSYGAPGAYVYPFTAKNYENELTGIVI